MNRFPPALLRWTVLAALLVGICLRFYNLDRKLFWHDETFTALRAAGHLEAEVGAQLAAGEPVTPQALQQFQRLPPGRSWAATWRSLQTHPEHPPAYYLGVRWVMAQIESPVIAARGLAAVFAVLALPSSYWLARELFADPQIAGVALALFAVSPFQILYAQEGRQYSLLTLAILLASAALLRAQRLQTRVAWVPYAIAVALGLYTSLFFPITIATHGIYAAITTRGWRARRWFLYAVACGSASFLPWASVITRNWGAFRSKTDWTALDASWLARAQLWSLHVSSGFLDSYLPLEHPFTALVPPIFLALGVAGIGLLYRRGNRRGALFVGTTIAVNFLALALPDVLFGGQRSLWSRYFCQQYIGLQLAVAYLVGDWLARPQRRARWVGASLLAFLLACGLGSSLVSTHSTIWWNKVVGVQNPEVAAIVNALPEPLLLLDRGNTALGNALSMSYLLHPSASIAISPKDATPVDYPSCNVVLYDPAPQSLDRWQQEPAVELESLLMGAAVRATRTRCR